MARRAAAKAGALAAMGTYSAGTALVAARVATHAAGFGKTALEGLASSLPSLPAAVASAPLDIAWASQDVAAWAAAGALLPVVVGLGIIGRPRPPGNIDTGREHGSARMATEAEAGSHLDARIPENNVMFGQGCGIAIEAYDKRTRDATRAMNLNCVTLGISGTGKTHNLVKYEIMQSLGTALPPVRGRHRRGRECAGFDIVHSDPKGQNLEDCGAALEAAGVDIRVLNTVDFRRSMGFNPLAHIPVYETDIKDPSDTWLTATAECSARSGARATLAVGWSADSGTPIEVSDGRFHVMVERRFTSTPSSPQASRQAIGGVPSEVMEAVEGVSYRRSTGRVSIEVSCAAFGHGGIELAVECDPAIVLEAASCTGGEVEWPDGEGGGPRVRWRAPPGEAPFTHIVELECSIAPSRVPDGVKLTRIVDCIVTNLQGTDANRPSRDDPFWESAKRLALMFFFSWQLERYEDPRWHTIPEAMDLLDLALPDDGDPRGESVLRAMVDEWEYGRRWEDAGPVRHEGSRGLTRGGRWVEAGCLPHARSSSMALHCYRAFMSGAPETVQSVIITCQAALVNLIAPDVREVLSRDEMGIENLGEGSRKTAIFLITPDTNSPYDFITSLLVEIAVSELMERAYVSHGGRLPRHVRFLLDEAANLGRIPVLVRALAVVRSRNVSISLYLQSLDQLELVYGEHEALVIQDNCSTLCYLGAMTEKTNESLSKRIGDETVYSRVMQRSYGGSGLGGPSVSESIHGNSRRVVSAAQMPQIDRDRLIVFMFGQPPAYVRKNDTRAHPMYPYIDPLEPRGRGEPGAVLDRFDAASYIARRRTAGSP